MFLDFYGLLEQPFGVTPDPTYLYPTRSHQEAFASISCGIKADRGFMVLVAEPGMGKTTLLYQLLHELRDSARTVFLFQTQCDSREFFRYVLDELGIDTREMGLVAMHTKLNAMLFDEMLAGRRFVLIVDEAQNLSESVLETIRLLSNFETQHAKLLQIVLAGQPGLAAKLEKPELSQLRQRIAVISHLEPLTDTETAFYLEHRLKVAGYWGEPVFAPNALELVAKHSKGVPRTINNICYNSLSVAHARGQKMVTVKIVEEALNHSEFLFIDPQSDTIAYPEPAPATITISQKLAACDLIAPADDLIGRRQPTYLSYEPLKKFNRARWIFCATAVASVLSIAILTWRYSRPGTTAPAQGTETATFSDGSKTHEPALALNASGSVPTTYTAEPQDTDSGQVLTVIAKPQQTLKEISLVYLGHFDQKLLGQIRSLNPGLTDPDHIQGGQLIQLPLRPHALTKTLDTSQIGNTAKNETQRGLFTKLVALLQGK
jgi:type II secretory pathway predicted ATPase ExeA